MRTLGFNLAWIIVLCIALFMQYGCAPRHPCDSGVEKFSQYCSRLGKDVNGNWNRYRPKGWGDEPMTRSM